MILLGNRFFCSSSMAMFEFAETKDIKLSGYQDEGFQTIGASGNNPSLISCYPDNHITINHTGSDVQQRLPKNET